MPDHQGFPAHRRALPTDLRVDEHDDEISDAQHHLIALDLAVQNLATAASVEATAQAAFRVSWPNAVAEVLETRLAVVLAPVKAEVRAMSQKLDAVLLALPSVRPARRRKKAKH